LSKTSWIKYVLYIASFPSDTPLKILFKGKPETGIEGLWQRLLIEDSPLMIWKPYSGKRTI
jgi:cinnamyl-alcohol dehydrogenase